MEVRGDRETELRALEVRAEGVSRGGFVEAKWLSWITQSLVSLLQG